MTVKIDSYRARTIGAPTSKNEKKNVYRNPEQRE